MPLDIAIANRDVLVVEDILDTGRSMRVLLDALQAGSPRSLRLCALLDKPERREIDRGRRLRRVHGAVRVRGRLWDRLRRALPTEYFGLGTLGAVAPGRRANLVVEDLVDFRDRPLGTTAHAFGVLEATARRLGARVAHPFGALSFLALLVVPQLRLTDGGLIDVDRGRVVPLWTAA